ncbi:related to component of the anaphase promoting complex [Melanopsichium pennsylvanicum]|uniref:Related to component of the anaphase promoting complex n=2 Tax=Melanopsichium pennsylvanicum TaxID=63383 RepID=A0AAJ5C3A7_9BASI|nr:related to component of the anaphase promoting complex [Melanopsichium pennsylvanicum 4]SNX82259.1 related to component of the anaphase promoting complex [Melanopsichium pennsylvanicum]
MLPAQAWKQAVQSLALKQPTQSAGPLTPNQLPSSNAYTILRSSFEPAIPVDRLFLDSTSGFFVLDTKAEENLQSLLGSDKFIASSSKHHLSSPSPILFALSNHFTERCLQLFDSTAVNYGIAATGKHGTIRSTLGEDLPANLAIVSAWFRAWLSLYNSGSIFQSMHEQSTSLLQSLQARLRSYFDRSAAESLRRHLEQLVVHGSDAELQTTLFAHLNTAGLSGTALSLLTRVMHSEVSRKVRAVVDAVDIRPQDSVLPLESAARPILQQWLDDEVKPRFAAMRDLCLHSYPRLESSTSEEDMVEDGSSDDAKWQHRLDYQLDKALCLVRAGQLFDLVAIYPDSSAALDDLRLSLQTADQRLSVAATLSSSLQLRLLHPGAHTRDIIQMYVHLVRALREVDPTGVVLSHVVSPLRKYLRGRKDTVLVIVASMLGDDPHFTLLKDELERADQEEQEQEESDANKRRRRPRRSLQTAGAPARPKSANKRTVKRRLQACRRTPHAEVSDSEVSSEEDWDDPNWVPKPVEAGSGYRMSTSKDIISMLTSIFDDRSSFISALEKSMADQLVQVKEYKAMREYRNNMILKKRFGERNMGKCDVMLGDVTESRRIDSEVHHRRRNAGLTASAVEGMVTRLHPLIVSRQFWPEHTTKPSSSAAGANAAAGGAAPAGTTGSVAVFTLPPLFRHAQEEYGKTFSKAKAMRKLHWLNHLGTVELDVELDSGESISVECSLMQASTLEVISRVKDRVVDPNIERIPGSGANMVTLNDVMEELNLQREKDGRDALEFWVQVGLLNPLPGLADAFLVQSSLPAQAAVVEEDDEAAAE